MVYWRIVNQLGNSQPDIANLFPYSNHLMHAGFRNRGHHIYYVLNAIQSYVGKMLSMTTSDRAWWSCSKMAKLKLMVGPLCMYNGKHCILNTVWSKTLISKIIVELAIIGESFTIQNFLPMWSHDMTNPNDQITVFQCFLYTMQHNWSANSGMLLVMVTMVYTYMWRDRGWACDVG